jgi:hypothetical protein
VGEEPEVNPIVRELVATTTLPYRALLPEEVVDQLGKVLTMTLEDHPVAVGLVARLSPALRVDVPTHETARLRNFQGYALPRVQRALLAKVREIAASEGGAEFVPPDLSMAALCAYVCYMQHDDRVWSEPEPVVRREAQVLADGIMAALFLGLMQELDKRPAVTQSWGDTGRALADASPRARALLARVLSKLPERIRTFLQVYRACGWELESMEKRLRLHGSKVNARCDEAVTRLGEVLRAELSADAPSAA